MMPRTGRRANDSQGRVLDLRAEAFRRQGIDARLAGREAAPPPAVEVAAASGRGWMVAGAVALVLVLFGAWIWDAEAPGRAVRALPDGQRASLYQATIEALKTGCEPAAPRSLRAFCRDQAALVLEFRECDAACREVAQRHLTQPTR